MPCLGKCGGVVAICRGVLEVNSPKKTTVCSEPGSHGCLFLPPFTGRLQQSKLRRLPLRGATGEIDLGLSCMHAALNSYSEGKPTQVLALSSRPVSGSAGWMPWGRGWYGVPRHPRAGAVSEGDADGRWAQGRDSLPQVFSKDSAPASFPSACSSRTAP